MFRKEGVNSVDTRICTHNALHWVLPYRLWKVQNYLSQTLCSHIWFANPFQLDACVGDLKAKSEGFFFFLLPLQLLLANMFVEVGAFLLKFSRFLSPAVMESVAVLERGFQFS